MRVWKGSTGRPETSWTGHEEARDVTETAPGIERVRRRVLGSDHQVDRAGATRLEGGDDRVEQHASDAAPARGRANEELGHERVGPAVLDVVAHGREPV